MGVAATSCVNVFVTASNRTDATSGKVLYSMQLGTTAKSGPSTFTVNGKQMIVQSLGGLPGFGRDEQYPGLNFGSMLVAFELQ